MIQLLEDFLSRLLVRTHKDSRAEPTSTSCPLTSMCPMCKPPPHLKINKAVFCFVVFLNNNKNDQGIWPMVTGIWGFLYPPLGDDHCSLPVASSRYFSMRLTTSKANICLLLIQHLSCYFLTGAWGSKAWLLFKHSIHEDGMYIFPSQHR